MEKRVISFIVALALAVAAALGAFPPLYENSGGTAPDGGENDNAVLSIEINAENFPDEVFRSFVAELEESIAEDQPPDGVLSEDELARVTAIDVSSMSVESLAGIEFFTFLETLNCSDNAITNLDLSGNKKLKELICSNNGLHSLDLCGLRALEVLDCGGNELPELVLNQNTLLKELHCSYNPLTELDLSSNLNISRLECSFTQITSLNIERDGSEDETYFELFEAEGNVYTVKSCNKDTFGFDLSSLPGSFDISRAEINTSEYEGLELVEETVLEGLRVGCIVTYAYYVGCGMRAEFTLAFEEGHTPVKVEDINSLCTALAELWQCKECGRCFADEDCTEEAAVGEHTYGEPIVQKEPTCTEEGVLLKVCTECGHEERESIERKPHTMDGEYESDYDYHWKVCSECGFESEKEAHAFEGDSRICLVCGKTVEHRHNAEFVEEKSPTCTEDGAKEHYYCEECGRCFADTECLTEILPEELVIDKLGHRYESLHDENGHWQQCALCEDKTDAEEHRLATVRTEPNCHTDGVVEEICGICGYSRIVEVLPATGEHNFGTEYSCDENSHWLSCTAEGCSEKNGETEHSFTKLEIIKKPNCSEEGVMNRICEVCGYSKSELIDKNGSHSYNGEYDLIDELTHAKVCTLCGKTSEPETHELGEGEIVKEAGCQSGIIRYSCECGYCKDEEIPALGSHSFDRFERDEHSHTPICSGCGLLGETEDHGCDIEIISPTCCESGKMIYTCKVCGYVYTETAGEPTGKHSFSPEFTVNDNIHTHKCEAEGCTAVDTHEADKCDKTVGGAPSENLPKAPVKAPVYSVGAPNPSDREISGGLLIEVPEINITWPTTAGVVLNPYKMKIKLNTVSEGLPPTVSDDVQSSGETVISNELAFINNGNTEVNITVTGSVTAVTKTDASGNPLLDDEGNPTTEPGGKITIATAPIKQPAWDPAGAQLSAGDTKNSVLIYIEVADKTSGTYSGVYDSKNANQMLLGTKTATKTLFSVAAKEGSAAGVANIKICGDVSTSPAIGWDKVTSTDGIRISLIFDASLAAPIPENPTA